MPEHNSGLRKRWSALRDDLVFLPKLDQMTVEPITCQTEAVEFVQVAPVDEEITVPAAPEVGTDDVRAFPGWSPAAADQQRMWALVGTAIEGNKVTRICPDCGGSRRLTCESCSGDGDVTCTWCGGFGHRACMHCGGSGHRTETRTTHNADGSTSTHTDHVTCMSCGGSGRERCMHCFGRGRVTCSTCSGHGWVECETCCEAGTVDTYLRRTFTESTAATHLLPVALPEFPGPVTLPAGYVQIEPRDAATPFDAAADADRLAQRAITEKAARIFFIRPVTVTVHTVRDAETGALSATYIDGEPEPILTLHRTVLDRTWTPDQERHKAMGAVLLYLLAPIALLLSALLHQLAIGAGVAVALLAGGLLLSHHPLRAFRMAVLNVSCMRHARTATMRCPDCGKDLCHECLLPSIRCPSCGKPVSTAVTHLIEDGRWIDLQLPVE